jgi:hypothetical protein
MWEDPIVAEVHRIREQLAAEFNYDIDAICADLRKRQEALGSRLIRLKPRPEAEVNGDSVGSASTPSNEAPKVEPPRS